MEQLTRVRIEQAAWDGVPMPEKLNPFEQLYWHGMCFIFHNFKNGLVNKETTYRYRDALFTEVEALEKEVLPHGDDQAR